MNTRKSSQQKESYRRQLKHESLESRCLLALTAFGSVDAVVTCELPAPESDTVIVARAIPADGTVEIVSGCNCPPDATQDVHSDSAAEGKLLECVVDEAVSMIDLTYVADEPSQYIFDITMVERTLADKVDAAEETTAETTDEVVTLLIQPEGDDADVTDDVSEDLDTGEESSADGEIESPIIYYTGPIVETTAEPDVKRVDGDGSSGPIIFRPTYEGSGLEVQQHGHEELEIYTLGGVATTTSDSQAANSNSDSDGGGLELSVPLTRRQRRELREERRAERRAERARERYERNLLAVENDRLNNQPLTTTPITTSDDDTPVPTSNDDKPLGGEIEQAVTSTHKPKRHGRRSGARR